ncbi:MAG: maleylpyruvate isomerase family mycothiol-dependent enzyme [Acidimicrobiales bacterium]
MGTVTIDLAETRHALEQVGAEVAELLRSLPDADAPIRSSDWTVRDTAVHLADDLRNNTATVVGAPQHFDLGGAVRTAERMTTLNARAVKVTSVTDPRALADLVTGAVTDFVKATEGRDGTEALATPWYGEGTGLDLDAMACVMLGEVVVHGYDMARAAGRSWPIEPRHAALILCGVADMLPMYVDPAAAAGVRATYDIRIRRNLAFSVVVDDGEATVHSSSGAADCHISADPVALLLVAYGRRSQWGPILQTKMLAWGRRPWLALSFRGLFANP